MATYYFRNTGNVNWSNATNWSLTNGGGATGAVPTVADDAIFTNLSGPCTVDITSRVCKTINFSTYTNTITMSNNITVSGNVTLGASMGVVGTGLLVPNATGTLTSNGKVWPNGLNLRGISTFTLADNWVVTGNLLIGAATETIVVNGAFTLSTAGNFTTGTSTTVSGTATIVLNGTGTWSNSSTGILSNNVTINTAGTITFGTNVYFRGGILTYTAGTVITTGNTFWINSGGTTTLNTNGSTSTAATTASSTGINFNNFIAGGTINITSNLCVITTLNSSTSTNFNNAGFTIYLNGNLTVSATGGGVTPLILQGTGTWSGNFTITYPLTINTTGTITISGTVAYSTGTITYVKGNVITKNSTLALTGVSTLINCHKIVFSTVTITAGVTITMNQFFSGSPSIKTLVQSSTTANYTIAFQDGFEKVAKFVNVNNATFTRPNQLIILTRMPMKTTNVGGIRYINQSPNGVAKNNSSVTDPMTYPVMGLVQDPNFII